jgi:FlaA1/EpsC-like NDP-sugar epimerase
MASLGTKISTTPAFPPPPVIDWVLSKRAAPAATPAFTRRQWLFVVADLTCIISGALLAILWRFASPDRHIVANNITLADHLSITVLYAVLISLLCYTQSLYSIYQPISRLQEFFAIAKSILMATFLLGGNLFVSGVKGTSRLVIAFTAVYALVSMLGWRSFRRWSLGKAIADGLSCHNVIIVGTDPTALSLARHLTGHRQLGFVVLGHLAEPPAPATEAAAPIAGLKILGSSADLKTLCRTHFADEIILCF